MDKSYVTLAICPICKKDTGTILLDKRLRLKFDRYTITPEPCKKCRKKYLKEGTMLFNPETGNLIVLKDTAFKKIFTISPKTKIVLCEQEILDKLNIKINKLINKLNDKN